MARCRVPRSIAWSVGVLALCGPAVTWAQVNPKKPYETGKVPALPALPGATGPLADSPINKTTPDDVHEGVYTWGGDLVNPGTTDEPTWLDSIYPTPPGPFAFTASPAFLSLLNGPGSALDSAGEYLDGLDAGGIGAAFTLFDDLPGDPVTLPTGRKEWFFGFRPERARWLKNRWAPTGQAFWMVEGQVHYADYAPFDDLRLQGARLYCAARRTRAVQGSSARSLGERVGFSINLLGEHIDFLVIEPTVAVDAPSKFLGDGAQAFAIPLTFGTRVTPIRGLGLPSLGETRVPVVLVTGDTEVKTASNKRLVFEIGKGGLVSKLVFAREHHTVTHADAVVSGGYWGNQKYALHKEFPVFALGPLIVIGLFDLTYEVGKPFLFTQQQDMPWHPDDRVLELAPWPNTPRTGHLYLNPAGEVRYHDGSWLLARRGGSAAFEWQVQPDGKTDPFWVDPIVKPSAIDLRALSNDDHTFATSTELKVTLGVKGQIGASAGPFEVTATVDGAFSGTVTQNHLLRDALVAQGPPPGFLTTMVPSPMVTVRPQQTADVTFTGLEASLHFHLDLWLDSLDFDEVIFEVPAATLAKYDSSKSPAPGDERYMLRIATGSAIGNSMLQPAAASHLPGGADFATFLTDVPACLADPAPAPPLDPPCPPQPGSGELPQVNICVYGPSLSLIEKAGSMGVSLPELPPGACGSLGTWPTGFGFDQNPALKACFHDYVALLCEFKSQQLVWNGKQVVSHVWNLDGPYGDKLKIAVEQCAEVFQAKNTPIAPALKEFLAELVSVGACDINGHLQPAGSAVQAVNPGQAPKPKPGAACTP